MSEQLMIAGNRSAPCQCFTTHWQGWLFLFILGLQQQVDTLNQAHKSMAISPSGMFCCQVLVTLAAHEVHEAGHCSRDLTPASGDAACQLLQGLGGLLHG